MRVADGLTNFVSYLGMEKELPNVFLLGLFHDIGKLNISPILLNKTERLNEKEFDEIKKHTIHGRDILKNVHQFPKEFLDVVLYHHENVDGSGYFGIKNQDIPHLSKMIRIIDSYDTMLYGRIYQSPTSYEDIIQEIISLAGIYYDCELVDSFIKFLHSKHIANYKIST